MDYKETIIDVETGEVTERKFTDEEIQQVQLNKKRALEIAKQQEIAEAELDKSKAALLLRLGITADEAKLLLA